MPYVVRYTSTSACDRCCRKQGGTASNIPRPFGGRGFFVEKSIEERFVPVEQKGVNDERKTGTDQSGSSRKIQEADVPEKLNDVRVKFLGKKEN